MSADSHIPHKTKSLGMPALKGRKLALALMSITIIAIIAIILIVLSQQYIVTQAENRMNDVMLEAKSLHNYVQMNMHPAMYRLKEEGRMPEDFYSPEILSSSYITRHVFHHFNEERKKNCLPLVQYKMASKDPRNIINLADSLEANLIDLFNRDSTIKTYTGIVKENGIKHLYYAKPFLRIKKACLKCHGAIDEAPYELRTYYNWEGGFNLQLGIIPAIEVIKTPMVAEFKTSQKIIIAILFFSIFVFVLILLNTRLRQKNEIIEKQNTEIEQNIIQLKEAQAQLVQTEKMASLGVLTAGVAHEINNPLNYIMGAYVGLENFFEEKPEIANKKTAKMLESISKGIDRAAAIVKGLNDFSRDNQNYSEDCNIHSIIDNCLLMLNNEIKHRIEIEKKYSPKAHIVKGNSGKLHQLFINIISNSIDAIDTKGKIIIMTNINEDSLIVEISDNGKGIGKDDLNKITDPFFTTKDPGKGTGLGLSICSTIINKHKGTLSFKSEKNTGTKVTIKLPLK